MHSSFCARVCVCVCVRARPKEQLSINNETDECVLCEAQHEAEERVVIRKCNKIKHKRMAAIRKMNSTLGSF
jgi:hypothetical protein